MLMITNLKRRQKPFLSIFFTVIIISTIPIVIYSLLQSQSFDPRNLAQEMNTTPTNCTINFPYVNTKTLAVNKRYQILVYGNTSGENIQSINIFDKNDNTLFTKNYQNGVNSVSEIFVFSPTQTGEENIFGEIKTDTGIYECRMDKEQELLFVVSNNSAPEFLTDPYISAIPPSNSVTTSQNYEYILEAADRNGDQIQYHYTFTPRANWINKTIIENGKDGKLQLKFYGVPDKEGSYLANIFIHDGYNKHLSAQSWIINVGTESSDTPVRVEAVLPAFETNYDNEIKLEQPQITKVMPEENATITHRQPTISANLIASEKASVKKDSIVMKLDSGEVTKDIEIIDISESEFLVRYYPKRVLEAGEHRVYLYFKDSNNLEIDKEWTFELDTQNQERLLFGLHTNTVMIVLIGIILFVFALSIPWILYISWKKNENDEYEELPILKPEGDSSFHESFPPSFEVQGGNIEIEETQTLSEEDAKKISKELEKSKKKE
jgi:hypothetical protein